MYSANRLALKVAFTIIISLFFSHGLLAEAKKPDAITKEVRSAVCKGIASPDQSVDSHFSINWPVNFPLVIFDAKQAKKYLANPNPKNEIGIVFWKATGSSTAVALSRFSSGPVVSTSNNLAMLICEATPGDGLTADTSTVAVQSIGSTEDVADFAFDGHRQPVVYVNRLYLIDHVSDDSLTKVFLSFPLPPNPNANPGADHTDDKKEGAPAFESAPGTPQNKPDNQSANSAHAADSGSPAPSQNSQTDLSKPPKPGAHKGDDAGAAPASTDILAWVLVERHKMVHYALGGGFVATRATNVSYSNITLPTTITTTTTTTKTTTVYTAIAPNVYTTTTGCPSGSNSTTCTTQVTSSETSTNAANSSGTAAYLLRASGSSWQINALAGLTFYPWGRDTYSDGRGIRYSRFNSKRDLANSFGLFFGTSVNTIGNFTGGVATEFFPGIQVLTAATFWSKTVPVKGITACSGYGTSNSYLVIPKSTTSDVTSQPVTPSGSAGPTSTTIYDNETSITTAATSGCSNGDAATMLSGTAVPTQTIYKPAFSIGLAFNSNLIKAFQGIFK